MRPDRQPTGNHSVDGVASSTTYPDDLDLRITACIDVVVQSCKLHCLKSVLSHLLDQIHCCQNTITKLACTGASWIAYVQQAAATLRALRVQRGLQNGIAGV